MRLGNTVDNIRSKGAYVRDDPERRRWLEAQGFEFDLGERQWQAVLRALRRYKELKGDMLVPRAFVVPSSSSDWPEEMWGMRLGSTVSQIRSSGTFVRDNADRLELLEAEGFVQQVRQSPAEKLRIAEAHYGRVRRGALAVLLGTEM